MKNTRIHPIFVIIVTNIRVGYRNELSCPQNAIMDDEFSAEIAVFRKPV
jgi:hypothetical protein